ncbi:hypothetical protein SPURM210S_07250 [Streptomyces purpurascens]
MWSGRKPSAAGSSEGPASLASAVTLAPFSLHCPARLRRDANLEQVSDLIVRRL